MPDFIPGLNKVCHNYVSYLFAAIFMAFAYFFLWGADIEKGVSANEQRSTSVEQRLDSIEYKLDTVGEDAAVSKAILERLERGQ